MKTRTCKLCCIEKELCNSHIIPAFFFRYIKKTGSQYVVTFMDEDSSSKRYGQSEFRESLLCMECERKIKVYEDYVRDLLIRPEKIHVTITDTFSHRCFVGINYHKLKLFQLSILWRASISKQEVFSKVQLDSHRNEFLRKMIYTGNPCDPHIYGCRMTLLYDDVEEGTPHRMDASKIMLTPVFYGEKPSLQIGTSWQVYDFVFGGYSWEFYISKKITSEVKKNFVTKEGQMCAPVVSIWKHPFVDYGLHKMAASDPKGALARKNVD